MDLHRALTVVLYQFLGHGDSCGPECYEETEELADSIMALLEEE